MNEKLQNNELFQASHMMILIAYTIFSIVLIGESILLSWELWAIPLVAAGLLCSWGLHITQGISEYLRLWVYSVFMMVTFFFYGIHETSTYDLAPVMTAVIVLYSMTGVARLILLNMITYYITMGYEIAGMLIQGREFDSLVITRTLLHMLLILMVGWIARVTIRKWGQVLYKAGEDITELQDATHRMDDFLANVSHEIRTPVNAVIGLIAVMLNKEKDPEIKKEMHSVSEAGHRVARQIGDILDYTEIDMEKLVVTDETYMLSSLLNDLVLDLSGSLETDLELVFDVDAGVPGALSGDASKVKKILWHLITNGLKFTKTGGVYVHIFSASRPYGINLCIEVRDTGIGMDMAEKEKIFDNFFQSNSGRTRSVGGLGLGIPIVHGFIQEMGGFLTIDSEKEEGTTVTVSVPQQIVDPTPCMSLMSSKDRCVAGFFRFEKYEHPEVREFYNEMISDLVKGLNVPFYRAEDMDGLRRLVKNYRITHLIAGAEEYDSGAEYMESLTTQMIVAVVADIDFMPMPHSGVKIMRKPFYCFPVVNILNMDIAQGGFADEDEKMYCPGVRALVVDDEPMNLIVAEGIFGNYGMDVKTVRSGIEAIEICQKMDFDIIFMDHMMPEMDGIEAMHQIRSLAGRSEKKKEFAMIALTANAVSSAREMFISEGFDGFVPKPIEISELERVLKRVLPKSAIVYERPEKNGQPSENVGSKQGQEEDLKMEIPVHETGKENGLSELEHTGILTEKGLQYCQNDMDFYRTLLSEYAKGAEEKEKELNDFYHKKDWENYAIRIHAVKSTSKMIGAEQLSDMAKELEYAAKNSIEGDIDRLHEETLSLYSSVKKAIFSFCGLQEKEDEILEDQDEILEFMPEGAGEEL